MADEDEYTYVPNSAVIGAVSNSLASGGVQGASGLSSRGSMDRGIPDYVSPQSRIQQALGNMPRRQRAAIEQKLLQNEITNSHNAAMESIARAKFALEASNSFYSNAKIRNEMIQQANQLNQAGGFLAEHAQLNRYSPDYPSQVNILKAKYPGSAGNKIVDSILNDPNVIEAARIKGDLPGQTTTMNALKQGWLKNEDFQNPNLYQNGTFNHEAAATLAALREGQSVEPPHVKTARTTLAEINRLGTDLNEQQMAIRDMATNTIYQFEQGRQGALGIAQPKKISAASFLPRATTTAPANPTVVAPPATAQTSIPKAPPPPTPAPTPVSPEDAAKLRDEYFSK